MKPQGARAAIVARSQASNVSCLQKVRIVSADRTMLPAYKSPAPAAMKAAVWAAPSPARALPAAATAKPASRSALPTRRRRKPRSGDHDQGERAGDVADDREHAGGEEREVLLRLRGSTCRRPASRAAPRAPTPIARPGVDERDRPGDPHAGEQQRAGAEERRSAGRRRGSRRGRLPSFQPPPRPRRSRPRRARTRPSPALQASRCGCRRARQRAASSPASRSVSSAAPKARSASTRGGASDGLYAAWSVFLKHKVSVQPPR